MDIKELENIGAFVGKWDGKPKANSIAISIKK
jgi:hypothetical protein